MAKKATLYELVEKNMVHRLFARDTPGSFQYFKEDIYDKWILRRPIHNEYLNLGLFAAKSGRSADIMA